MANENNNANELVSTDDDVTAELQELTLQQVLTQSVTEPELEDDADTFEFERMPGRQKGVEVLSADLKSRAERIERLQYDLEALRLRFNGLTSEVRAREEITRDLQRELADTQEKLTTRNRQLQQRDRSNRELKAEIRERQSQYQERLNELEAVTADRDRLAGELDDIQVDLETLTAAEVAPPTTIPNGADASLAAAEANSADLRSQLGRTEAYADSLRKQLADQSERAQSLEKQLKHSEVELSESESLREQQDAQIRTQGSDNRALGEQIAIMQARHNEEIKALRGELAAAADRVAGAEASNEALRADLVEKSGYRDEMERMFEQSDEKYRHRLKELETELARMTELNAGNEAKLASKTEALAALIAEVSKQPPPEAVEDSPPAPEAAPRDRVNRMLIGRIDNQELRFPLFKKRLTIGRTQHNDIQLNVPYISRRHAVVLTDGDATRVVDWGSRNGVYVNSRRITEHFLESGDRVTIGNAEFRYEERPRRDT